MVDFVVFRLQCHCIRVQSAFDLVKKKNHWEIEKFKHLQQEIKPLPIFIFAWDRMEESDISHWI